MYTVQVLLAMYIVWYCLGGSIALRYFEITATCGLNICFRSSRCVYPRYPHCSDTGTARCDQAGRASQGDQASCNHQIQEDSSWRGNRWSQWRHRQKAEIQTEHLCLRREYIEILPKQYSLLPL